jgi:hypothetical protein
MTSIPVADSFLASSLLTILLPLAMFIALAVWYVTFVRRVPDTVDASKTEPALDTPPDAAAPKSEG